MTPSSPPPSPSAAAGALPDLPSGRPRRMLIFTAGLQPDDLTLRAFDLARHLHAHGRWFARVVSGADGPLRTHLERAAIPVQVVDQPADAAGLVRQVWGTAQDAAVAFGAAQAWVAPLAGRHGWPLWVETQDARAWFDPYASPDRRAEVRSALGLSADDRLALAFATESTDEKALLGLLQAIRAALSEARLTRWHLGLIGANGHLHLLTPDAEAPPSETTDLAGSRSTWVAAADAVLDLHKHATGFRPLFDAAALAVPIVADPTPSLATLLPAPFVAPAELGSPSDAADALIDLVLNPEAASRRVAAAHVFVMAHRNPARLLPSWIDTLEATVHRR